jgi:hypothetical protein
LPRGLAGRAAPPPPGFALPAGFARRGAGASGNAFFSSASSAWAVTHTGVCALTRE